MKPEPLPEPENTVLETPAAALLSPPPTVDLEETTIGRLLRFLPTSRDVQLADWCTRDHYGVREAYQDLAEPRRSPLAPWEVFSLFYLDYDRHTRRHVLRAVSRIHALRHTPSNFTIWTPIPPHLVLNHSPSPADRSSAFLSTVPRLPRTWFRKLRRTCACHCVRSDFETPNSIYLYSTLTSRCTKRKNCSWNNFSRNLTFSERMLRARTSFLHVYGFYLRLFLISWTRRFIIFLLDLFTKNLIFYILP